nr:carboxypeptidase-like regulatory domain-containing protein [Granulicella arctica]
MKWLVFAGTLIPWPTSAQQACTNGIRVEGTIADPTGAVIPGAQVCATSGETATTDTAGHYVLRCIPAARPSARY